ncbi:MAG: undecaprenyldiphospho-muramoylpentapeptide beta-N-acetylglucosaminyltransferase [Vicinamibacterales bacterium]
MTRPTRVVIAGGGTGGHLYPGLAVARALQELEPGCVVTFAGTSRGLEARVVPREGFELDTIRSAGLKGKSWWDVVRGWLLLPLSAWDAWRVVTRRHPDVVVGVGGYSSGPLVGCAALRRIRTLVLEQNAVPGLTNRLLAGVVDAAAVTFESTSRYFGGRAFVSGNPVRQSFWRTAVEAPVDAAAPGGRVLVFGGSQGARAVNRAVVDALPLLARRVPPPHVTHQTGEADLADVRRAYERSALPSRVDAFMHDLDDEMARADVVVCRAGATTLAEVAAAGRAAILIPLPTATDDHQRRNASVLAEADAAVLLDERDLTGASLATVVGSLLDDTTRRLTLAANVRGFAKPDAAAVVAARVLELAGSAA